MANNKNYKMRKNSVSNSNPKIVELRNLLEQDISNCNITIVDEDYIPLSSATQKLYYELLTELSNPKNEVRDWLNEHGWCIMRLGRMTLDLGIFNKSYFS